MSLDENTPKNDQESLPVPPRKSSGKFRLSTPDTPVELRSGNSEEREKLLSIPEKGDGISSHPVTVRIGPKAITVETVPPNKIVLLFGVLRRELVKAYVATGVKVRHLSLSEEEDAVIINQGLGLSIFRGVIGGTINPTLAGGSVGLVILGNYQDSEATREQRRGFAESIAPVVEE